MALLCVGLLAACGKMEAALQTENLVFFPHSIEVGFPQGMLPSQQYTDYLGVQYRGALSGILHDWAIPTENIQK